MPVQPNLDHEPVDFQARNLSDALGRIAAILDAAGRDPDAAAEALEEPIAALRQAARDV